VARRTLEAEKIKDPVEKDIFIRYGMEPAIWRKSQRNYFPYNLSLTSVICVPFVVPMGYLLFHLTVVTSDLKGLKTLLQTIVVSMLGYLLTDRLILAFKDNLC